MGLQHGEVDLHDAVVILAWVCFNLRVSGEQVLVLLGKLSQFWAASGLQVGGHPLVVGEYIAGSTQFSAHVSDGGLAGAAYGVNAGAEVLDDSVGAPGNGQDTGQVDDYIFGRSPTAEFTGQFYPD